uniref:Protein kinase superfamily protein n=1 Tax=Tanacetum cinerariifolium TaxID=118510 RepID=A0A6L2P7D2_TANCI|nr:protein kinase superfamily protein [Tanacetum cinerariifolium]
MVTKEVKALPLKLILHPPKLVKASKKVCMDHDAQVLIDFEIDGIMIKISHDQLQAHLDKKEQMEHTMNEAELSKPKIMKVTAEIPAELGLDLTLLLHEQDTSLLRRKRKAMELEPETYITGLHRKRELPKGVKFVRNLVIEEPEHELFFIWGRSIKRVNDVHKVKTKTLLGYKVMASNVKIATNQRFMMLMSRMIDKCPDKNKILNKRVKLESYTDV